MKRTRKKNKKGPVIPIAITAVGLLLIVSAFIFFGKSKDQEAMFESGTPVLVVDQTEINYGDVKFGTEKTFSIRVTNNGDGILRFKEEPYIKVLEGC